MIEFSNKKEVCFSVRLVCSKTSSQSDGVSSLGLKNGSFVLVAAPADSKPVRRRKKAKEEKDDGKDASADVYKGVFVACCLVCDRVVCRFYASQCTEQADRSAHGQTEENRAGVHRHEHCVCIFLFCVSVCLCLSFYIATCVCFAVTLSRPLAGPS